MQRWDKAGASWFLSYIFTTGYGARSLTVDFTGQYPVIYAIVGGSTNRVMRFVDAGVSAPGTVLITPQTNTAFRGVRFAPALPVDSAVAAPKALKPTGLTANVLPVLQWAPVVGAIGYDVGLTLPSGITKWLEVNGATNVTSPLSLSDGAYTWTVSAFSVKGGGPAAAGSFSVQKALGPLRAVKSGTNVLVSWPQNTAPATLLSATNLTSATWTPVTQKTAQTNSQNVVTVPISAAAQYFILRASP